MTNFAEMASLKDDDLPAVKKLPMGSYIWSVDRLPETKVSTKGNGENITFRMKCQGTIPDFDGDESELAEFGEAKGTVRTHRFYYPTQVGEDGDEGKLKNNQARVLQEINTFLRDHLRVEGDSLSERMANCLHHQCIGFIKHVPDSRNPRNSQEEFGQTAPILDDDE